MKPIGKFVIRLLAPAFLAATLCFQPALAEEAENPAALDPAEVAKLMGEMLAYAGALNDLEVPPGDRELIVRGLVSGLVLSEIPEAVRDQFSTAYEAMQARFNTMTNGGDTSVPLPAGMPEVIGYMAAAFTGIEGYPFTPEEIEAIGEGFAMGLESEGPSTGLQTHYREVYERLATLEEAYQATLQAEKEGSINAFFANLAENPNVQSDERGLHWEVIEPGEGAPPAMTDTVTVHYKGTLIDGRQFDSSYDRGEPASFPMDGVVQGFSGGLSKIGKGGKVKIFIPAELGYGNNPRPGGLIQPGDPLVFECELIDIERPQ